MSSNPCVKDCPNRSATCHAECERYAAFAKEREAVLAQKNKQQSIESRLDGYAVEMAIKARRRRRRPGWKLK